MKTKLIKNYSGFDYFLADENGSAIATSDNGKLSKQNCDEIFGVVDVERLAENIVTSHPNFKSEGFSDYQNGKLNGIIEGFNKAMELMGDKKFSDKDIRKAIQLSQSGSFKCEANGIDKKCSCTNEIHCQYKHFISESEIIQSLQQTEWDVEVQVDNILTFGNPILDADGCLILKKIE
jgi:hypothetical protein